MKWEIFCLLKLTVQQLRSLSNMNTKTIASLLHVKDTFIHFHGKSICPKVEKDYYV